MKILAVSDHVLPQIEDTNYLRRTYADVEAVISCGDLPGPYLDLITSTINMPLFYVRGNHDVQYRDDPPGGDDLDRRIVTYHGLTIAGLEGSPRYNDAPIQYTETEMFFRVLGFAARLLVRRLRFGSGLDVMVSHASPRDIHDRPDKPHRGFRSLRLLIRLYRPRYLLHGHVDTWDRRRITATTYAGTEVININPLKVLTIEKRERRPKSGS